MQYILSVIYQFLEENYFSSSLDGHYEYLDFSGTNTTLLLLVGGLLLGVIVASFMIYYQKSIVGGFVRRLLRDRIHTPDDAIFLTEKDSTVKRELCSRSSALRKLISYEEDGVIYDYKTELSLRMADAVPDKKAEDAKQEEKVDIKEKRSSSFRLFGKDRALTVRKPDFAKARFFLPEELAYRAELRYGKRAMTVGSLILTVILCILAFFAALRLIPIFVSMLDVTIGNVIGGI